MHKNDLLKPIGYACLFIMLLFFSCRKQVFDDIPTSEIQPVLNCFLIKDSTIRVHVSLTRQLDTIPLQVVNNAHVVCTINHSDSIILRSVENGYYIGDRVAQEGSYYSFRVSIPGFSEMIASDTIPEQVSIKKIEHINYAGVDEEGHTYPAVKITFPVDLNQIKYFQVNIILNVYSNQVEGQLMDISDPVLLAEGIPILVFSTARIKDTTYTMKINYTTGYVINRGEVSKTILFPFTIVMRTISYSCYQYMRQLYLYKSGRYPEFTFGPYRVFPLYSNVDGGMGIVAGYANYVSELIYPEE